ELDSIIEKNLQNWKLDRISKINLCILEMGIYEMLYVEDVPEKVALNEALELTKRYSDEKSVSFVNGVLDKVLKNI
ncbi:transcription antitermination factor NusB, partial [Clostridium paraputrificum]